MPITVSFGSPSNLSKLPPSLAKVSHDEVVLIELQGSLHIEGDLSEKDGQLVGTLKMDEACTRPTMMIGHHLLEGKVQMLPKPLAILHRIRESSRRDDGTDVKGDDEMDMDVDEATPVPSLSTTTTRWEAIAIVKRKIVFSKRPMPIVGRKP